MVAIAFSLSAYSEGGIYKLDEHKKVVGKTQITVWCIADTVVVESSKGGLTQLMQFWAEGGNPMECRTYKREMQ